MEPAEVALIVDRKSFQEISLLHDERGHVGTPSCGLGLPACRLGRDGSRAPVTYVTVSRASLTAKSTEANCPVLSALAREQNDDLHARVVVSILDPSVHEQKKNGNHNQDNITSCQDMS